MSAGKYVSDIVTIIEFDLRKLRHDPTQGLTRLVQPILWLALFGTVMSQTRAFPTGTYTFMQFLTPGVLAQSVMFIAIFYGISIVWERDLGQLNKLLCTPTARSSIILGKTLSAGIRSTIQGIGVLIIAFVMQINLSFTVWSVLGIIVLTILFGVIFSSLSICLASFFTTRERMMGIGQALTMPLFFASNAIYPLSLMPDWVRYIAHFNPLTYIVDAMRSLLLPDYPSSFPLILDVSVIVLAALIMVTFASVRFKKMVS
jgi:ABC-2 type transport system permease protein